MKLGHLSYSITLEKCITAELWVRLNGDQVQFGVRRLPHRVHDTEWPKHYDSLSDAHEMFILLKETSNAQITGTCARADRSVHGHGLAR